MMCHANLSLAPVRLCFAVAVGFFAAAMSVREIQAQPAVVSERPFERRRRLQIFCSCPNCSNTTSRAIRRCPVGCAGLRGEPAEIGVVAVMDKTGSEILELGSRNVTIAAGDTIRVEGQDCLLRRRELGIQITSAPELDNDGVHAFRGVTAEVRLTAGLHPFQLDYFNLLDTSGLELTCRLPDGSVQTADRFLVRPGGGMASESNLMAGLNATCYEGGWLDVPDFALLEPVKTVATTNLNTNPGSQKELFGIRYKGFFSAPMDGEYSFNLGSDDGSLLFLDAPEIQLARATRMLPEPSISSFARALYFGCIQKKQTAVVRSQVE